MDGIASHNMRGSTPSIIRADISDVHKSVWIILKQYKERLYKQGPSLNDNVPSPTPVTPPRNKPPSSYMLVIDTPGSSVSPSRVISRYSRKGAARLLTAIDILVDEGLDGALVHVGHGLRLERAPVLAALEHAGRVHGALERVALPAEEVVGVGAVALVVLGEAEHEGVGPAAAPHAVELGRVPEGLVGDLGGADRMRGRAWPGGLEGLLGRVVHVRLVVGRVEVLAVPARGEVVHRHDAALAGRGGEVGQLGEAGALVLQADEAQADVALRRPEAVGRRVADGHAEALVFLLLVSGRWEATYIRGYTHGLEGCDFLVAVGVEVLLGVVDCHAAVDAVGQRRVLHDGDSLIRAVRRVLEEHDGRPVVGEVLAEGARRAGAPLADIALHGRVEGISSDDLVKMGRGDLVGLDEGVEPLDGEGRASEPKGGLGRRSERKGYLPLHAVRLGGGRWDLSNGRNGLAVESD